MSKPLPIAVLVSGAGTNLQVLLDTVHGREAQIVAVASNVPSVPALERADAGGVSTAVFSRGENPQRDTRQEALANWLDARQVRLVVLAGYMEMLGESFLARFPDAVINVHPSLLPAFPGVDAIEQAIAYGVKVFGATVHFVDTGMDSGPVILQRAVELQNAGDREQVLEVLHELEHALLPEAVRLFARGALSLDPANRRKVLIDGQGGFSRSDGVVDG